MFKKSRIKIVVAIMSILVILWVVSLGVIYAFSYFEMSKQNKQLLEAHAEMYTLPQSLEGKKSPSRPFRGENSRFDTGFIESPMFQLTTFYTVAVSYDGDILEVKNDPPTVHSDNELKQMAQDIIDNDQVSGMKGNLSFYKVDKDGYILVTFMDNTVVNQGAMTLFRYTFIFGGAVLVLFFFLSVFLAREIVNPLEKSYRKQNQFISDAGHELKTPISVVSVNAELLSREIGDNQWLQNIQYENERMGMLVGQLLDIARNENVIIQKEHIDFSHLVAGEVLPFESVAFDKGLALNSNICDNIKVEGSSIQLKQLVSIMLDNAICHSQESGEISLSLKKVHGIARLSVINRGEKIPIEQQEQLFERFYRVDSVRNSEGNHYGLGLAIAKAIVISHKGQIEVFCNNGFVEFRVQIPVLKEN